MKDGFAAIMGKTLYPPRGFALSGWGKASVFMG